MPMQTITVKALNLLLRNLRKHYLYRSCSNHRVQYADTQKKTHLQIVALQLNHQIQQKKSVKKNIDSVHANNQKKYGIQICVMAQNAWTKIVVAL